ncbi:transcription-repair coupling factor [Desulfovibrio inopinatus]|uniref:transcription-repair coupling factor n=1 Tax=Desulfovibrio inopinatus TaxID=102109 RepID=UPI00042558C6|nr:transcription-repair coupling factor [Desulfovibrio inopinatus]
MLYPKEIKDFFEKKTDVARIYKSGVASLAFLCLELVSQGRNAVVLVPGASELTRITSLLQLLFAEDEMVPLWERRAMALPTCLPQRPTSVNWAKRWAFLYGLETMQNARIMVLTADNFIPKWPERDVLRENSLVISKGEELLHESLLEQAVQWGYQRRAYVNDPGEIAVRGDILDVFPPGYKHPVRLEFFGEEVEALRLFDQSSQRSLRELDSAVILPAAPAVPSPGLVTKARSMWKEKATTGELSRHLMTQLDDQLERQEGLMWPGLFYENPTRLEEWFPADTVFVLARATELRPRIEEQEFAWREFFAEERTALEGGWPRDMIVWPEGSARNVWVDAPQIIFEDLLYGHGKSGVDLPERSLESFHDLFWKPDELRRPWATLVKALADWNKTRRQTILSFHTKRSRDKFLKMTASDGLGFHTEYGLDATGLFALISPLKKGMDIDWNQTLILAEDILQPSGSSTHDAAAKKAFEGLTSFDDINPDDLLVHRDYGVCRFEGLSRLNIGTVANDFLLLMFDADDKLYLPVDRLSLVKRFKGPEGASPSLDKLGGTRWKASRSRAQKAIERIAKNLVEMYAFRKVAKGYAYGPMDDLYWEFEATFGFEETPDQERVIAEVFRDMERPEPMDRLVCGDVGFGKTEVAMRAAFRAVLDGKQVAILCPTTVLAEQHFQNLSKRMEGFPVKVGMLSRFVPAKRQKVVLNEVARGQIDILIGTHRLLSKDVIFPNLGLLILDEEQRFGVKHKERIKEMRKNIDALTLTATPIPRTLQLSMSGLRGLSVIETPPTDRKPVETALIERDDAMLAKIIQRELDREGQVFYVHNRVQDLETVTAKVATLAPNARIGMAHGQMPEKQLEEAMHKFWHGEIDILVCTAIIESGLDFPRANTLIVDQAHMFGLGQLYQLRGRVGRSERQAYAYFMTPSLDALSEISKKRLRVILDMDYLGAGFQVAMEDLRLRGAGNILGEAQSGHIAKIGLDFFLEMLEDEVRRLKGEAPKTETEPELTFGVKARIPETYIEDAAERLRWYKAMTSAEDDARLAGIRADMVDRYGHVPEELENFLAALSLKRTMAKLGVEKADLSTRKVVMHWAKDSQAVDPTRIFAFVDAHSKNSKLLPPAGLEWRLPDNEVLPVSLAKACDALSELV